MSIANNQPKSFLDETSPTTEKPLGELTAQTPEEEVAWGGTASKSKRRASQGSLSGGMTLGSQLQPMSQIAQEVGAYKYKTREVKEYKTRAKAKRQPKNTSGIWIVEKSLDKKHWVASAWFQTRQKATEAAESAQDDANNIGDIGLGLFYRVTRYEPTR